MEARKWLKSVGRGYQTRGGRKSGISQKIDDQRSMFMGRREMVPCILDVQGKIG